MLVNEIKTYKVIICGQEVELKLDFNALIQMHKEYGNAFLLVHDYVFQSDLEKLPQIVRCMANKEFTEEEIKSNMLINISSIEILGNITLDLLNQELTNTSEFKKEVKKNHNPSNEKEKK